MVWGFTEIRVTPNSFSTRSLSAVMLSARPASTVNSFTCEKSKVFRSRERSRSSWSGSSVVGVPPPMYTLSSTLSRKASRTKSISFSIAVRYSSTRARHAEIGKEVKEQYRQVVGQKGIPTYRL